jgi:ribosomal 50S subunit-recycling heat shock protein
MRLDLYLKVSRLVPSRSLANELCAAGRIFVNDIEAKPSRTIHTQNIVRISRKDRNVVVEILIVPEKKQASKEIARTLYRVIE